MTTYVTPNQKVRAKWTNTGTEYSVAEKRKLSGLSAEDVSTWVGRFGTAAAAQGSGDTQIADVHVTWENDDGEVFELTFTRKAGESWTDFQERVEDRIELVWGEPVFEPA